VLSCDAPTLEKLHRVAESNPRFPFTYYGIALCQRKSNEPTWRTHAEKAVEILKMTTSLEDHHAIHDKILAELKGYLGTTK
jgi:hypothetical protein